MARAIGVDVCTPIEKFRGRLEAVKNDNGPAKGFQKHDVFWDLSRKPDTSNSNENEIGRTKVSFAVFLEHPAFILELKGISENRQTPWAGWNFAPWAPCTLYR
jgi:hypothetical protein